MLYDKDSLYRARNRCAYQNSVKNLVGSYFFLPNKAPDKQPSKQLRFSRIMAGFTQTIYVSIMEKLCRNIQQQLDTHSYFFCKEKHTNKTAEHQIIMLCFMCMNRRSMNQTVFSACVGITGA